MGDVKNFEKAAAEPTFDFGNGEETVDGFLRRTEEESKRLDAIAKVLNFALLASLGIEAYLLGKAIGQKQGYSMGVKAGKILGEHGVYAKVAEIVSNARLGGAA